MSKNPCEHLEEELKQATREHIILVERKNAIWPASHLPIDEKIKPTPRPPELDDQQKEADKKEKEAKEKMDKAYAALQDCKEKNPT